MKKINSVLVILFLVCVTISAQNVVPETLKNGIVPSRYNRNALTVVILDNNGSYINDIKKAAGTVQIPEKFDDNNLTLRYFSAPSTSDQIRQGIENLKLPNHVLAKWFSRDVNTGKFDMSLIGKRGMYNATTEDMIKASASKIGLDKIKDAGRALVNNSYIEVLDIRNVMSMEEYYNKVDASARKSAAENHTEFVPVKRNQNGWTGEVFSFLYKIDSNAVDSLYDKMWIYDDDDISTQNAKKALFDKATFRVSFVMMEKADASAVQYNPGQTLSPKVQLTRAELFAKLNNSALQNSLFVHETKYEAFRVKTSVYAIAPVRAKVGTKEGLSIDQRYFVFENIQNSKGETFSKRRGVVRVEKVANNSTVATVNSAILSDFYQTAGRKLEPGMTMQQRNDLGLGVSFGTTLSGEMGGFYGKVEKTVGLTPQFKVFLVGSIENKDSSVISYQYLRYKIGISKGFYFARNFSIAPFIAYGIEDATWTISSTDKNISTAYYNAGVYATINILHNVQLVGTANYYILSGNAYDDKIKDLGFVYDKRFANRKGLSLDLGLRIEL
jgi:hypothetical protein